MADFVWASKQTGNMEWDEPRGEDRCGHKDHFAFNGLHQFYGNDVAGYFRFYPLCQQKL